MPKCDRCDIEAPLNHFNFCEECILDLETDAFFANERAQRQIDALPDPCKSNYTWERIRKPGSGTSSIRHTDAYPNQNSLISEE